MPSDVRPFGPLPRSDGNLPTRRGKFIDVEVFGNINASSGTLGDLTLTGTLTVTGTISGGAYVGGDIESSNWVSGGGTSPATSLPDASATVGYYLDASAGAAQFLGTIFLGTDIRISSGLLQFGTTPHSSISGPGTTSLINILTNMIKFNHRAAVHTDVDSGMTLAALRGSASSGTNLYDDVYPNISRWVSAEANDGNNPRATFNTRIGGASHYNEVDSGSGPYYYSVIRGESMASTVITPQVDDVGQPPVTHVYVNDATYGSSTTIYGQILSQNGTASLPAHSFYNDTDTGMYRYGSDVIGWSSAGVRVMALDSTYWYGAGTDGGKTSVPIIRIVTGTAATPTYAFNDDTDTGMYLFGTNTIGWSVAGALGMKLTADKALRVQGQGIAFEGTNGTGTANNIGIKWSSPNFYARVDNAVEAVIGTASDPRLKDDIQPLEGGLARIAALSPITFLPLDFDGSSAGTVRMAGLNAEEVRETEPWLVTGEGEDYLSLNYVGLIPLLINAVQESAAKINRLEKLLEIT